MMINYSCLFDIVRDLYANLSFDNTTGKIKMPMRYVLELTYRCNLKCPFCYITGKRCIDELNTQEWFDIINQIPAFSLITFCAGEVLIKKDFIDIYKKASEKFRKVTVISNGLALNEEIIDSFIKNKLMLLSVSLDAYGKKHDEIRKFPNLWDKVINNLEMFNSKRNGKQKPMLDIKTCVLENNLDDLPKLYKESQKLNAQFYSLTFIRKQPLRQNSILYDEFGEDFYLKEYPPELYFDMEHFKEIYKELESLQKTSKTILRYAPRFKPTGDIKTIEKVFNAQNKSINDIYKPCKIPMTSLYITPGGEIYPCLSYKVASLKDMPLKEAINTVKYKCFRKNLYRSGVFNACQMCCDLQPKNQ